VSPERVKYDWSGSRSPDAPNEQIKRPKLDDKVCVSFWDDVNLLVIVVTRSAAVVDELFRV
jgi:hypothetical protein